MLKKYFKPILFSSLLILLPMIIGLILWERLPVKIPMHWNLKGEIDKFGSKGTLVFLFPLFLLGIHIISILATFLDPKNKNQNKKVYRLIFFVTPLISNLFSGVIFASTIGFSIQMESFMSLFFCILFFFLGNYLPKCKKNYTIGIKIVWTLDNTENWNATHRFAGKIWTVSSVLFLIFAFVPKASIFLSLILVIVITLIPVIYSYIFYRKQIKKEE